VSELTQKRLKQLLHYDPDTGGWVWLVDRMSGGGRKVQVHAGDRAGYVRSDGYVRIQIDGAFYLGHRLAFLYMLDRWPAEETDHINLIRSDNRWCNLRDATHSQNQRNSEYHAKMSDLPRGVTKDREKFRAQIYRGMNKSHLGTFDTPEEASAAYEAAAKELYGEFYCEPDDWVAPPPPPPPPSSPPSPGSWRRF
jgi:hypothetical protein